MNKPQKHAAVIKAWADGAEIEYKRQDGSWDDSHYPSWSDRTEFRVKPTKVTRWLWVYKNTSSPWRISTRYLTDDEAALFYHERKKLDFSEMEFDE